MVFCYCCLAQFLAKVFVLNWLWGVLRLAALARSFNPKEKMVSEPHHAQRGGVSSFFRVEAAHSKGEQPIASPIASYTKTTTKDQYKICLSSARHAD